MCMCCVWWVGVMYVCVVGVCDVCMCCVCDGLRFSMTVISVQQILMGRPPSSALSMAKL